jgi:hypothetical protein
MYEFLKRYGLASGCCGLLPLGAICVASALAASAVAQKSISVDQAHREDAVAVTRVTVSGNDIQCGLIISPPNPQPGMPPVQIQPVAPFQAGADWLQNTTIYLLNRTNKTVVAGQVALVFPETGTGTLQSPLNEYNITLGRLPAVDAFSYNTGRPLAEPAAAQPISLAGGQTLAINLGAYIQQIKASVINLPYASLTKCIVRRKSFFFDDGMKWSGAYWVPDPQNAGKFSPLAPKYFPGIPTWPPGSR